MEYVLGIDGGGTSTICLLADRDGHAIAQAEAPASNHRKLDLREACEAVAAGVKRVFERAGLLTPQPPRLIAACAGLAGVDTEEDAALLSEKLSGIVQTEHLRVVNDGEIALYGALEDEPGVLVISGTGSIVWAAREDGTRLRVGGWDYILGDEGSGYSIGMRVLRAVASAHDRRTPPTRLTGEVFNAFGARRFEDLLGVIYDGEMTPQRIAALAPLADTAASEGDGVAHRVIEEAAEELVQMVASAVRLAGLADKPFPVVPTGGVLLAGGAFSARFRALMCDAAPNARFVEPRHSSVEGAILLALSDLVKV